MPVQPPNQTMQAQQFASPNPTPSQAWLEQLKLFQSNPQSRIDWMKDPSTNYQNWIQQHGPANLYGSNTGSSQPVSVNPTPGTVTNPVSTQPGSVPQSTPDTNWFQNYMNRINYGFNFNYPNFANQSQDMGF